MLTIDNKARKGHNWWIEAIRGGNDDNSQIKGYPLSVGKVHNIRAEIRKGNLKAYLDENLLFSWEGEAEKLVTPPAWREFMKDENRLYLGCNAEFTIHKMTFVPKGEAAVLAPPANTAASPFGSCIGATCQYDKSLG